MTMHDVFALINKIIVGIVVWMITGFLLVLFYGFPFHYLRSPLLWLFWCAAAPALAIFSVGIFALVDFLVPRKFWRWVMTSTPIGWCLSWILNGEDAIDRMLRVGAAALAFLVVFLVAIRLIFGPV